MYVHYGSGVFAIHESAKYLNNAKVVLKSVQQTWYTIFMFGTSLVRYTHDFNILFNYLYLLAMFCAVKIGRYIFRNGLGFLFSFTCSSTVI